MLSEGPVSVYTVLNLSDIRSAHRLWLIKDIVFVLAVEPRKLLAILKIEVCLDSVEEHDWIA